ncbi:TetR/AcrR family transcriptional regulator [Roseivirga misakiensis]|uniref:TetR family transcriptional regulator n=1 Tax=Roseivirga misakiensis TaxID=1563681 RepID=A0A1E5SY50_9BACT|nr:TetR/AcrR family transcriptional regulator [Roseivirga misakiensis]OEK03967.1 TetR family transcriptional regulator [Roseivirga misakiensis]
MALLRLEMNANLFLRDPQETDLGRKIIDQSIRMIDELGLEAFTFKKLSKAIDSTEASIYRYFENKHKLLVYLIAWYWNWLEYRIDFETHNVKTPEERLAIALRLVTEQRKYDKSFPSVDELALQRIITNESDKTYLTKQVDSDNKEGLFRGFKSLCGRLAEIILEINPDYPYAHSLVSTVLQAAHQQVFFAEHLPSLTNHKADLGKVHEDNYVFLLELIQKAIKV